MDQKSDRRRWLCTGYPLSFDLFQLAILDVIDEAAYGQKRLTPETTTANTPKTKAMILCIEKLGKWDKRMHDPIPVFRQEPISKQEDSTVKYKLTRA